MYLVSRVNPEKEKKKFDVATTLRYYVDVALPIGRQTTALWFVFPEDLEEAAEVLAGRQRVPERIHIEGNRNNSRYYKEGIAFSVENAIKSGIAFRAIIGKVRNPEIDFVFERRKY